MGLYLRRRVRVAPPCAARLGTTSGRGGPPHEGRTGPYRQRALAVPVPWQSVFLTYPCPTCGAGPGDPCRTARGNVAEVPHAGRTRNADRCPKCGGITNADTEPGGLCPRCALVRSLEVERSTTWKRQDPD